MRSRGFFFWLVLFMSGSLIWVWPAPWAEVMGRAILFAAVFVGVSAPRWRTEARFRTPRAVVGVQFANLLPMFVIGFSAPTASRPAILMVIYLFVAALAICVNSYVGLSPRGEGAA